MPRFVPTRSKRASEPGPKKASRGSCSRRPRARFCVAANSGAASGCLPSRRIGHSLYQAAIRYQHVVAERYAAVADALTLKARPKRDRSGTDMARGHRKPRKGSIKKASDQGGNVVELMGLEPTTPCLQSRCSSN
jgi:hypothetical protein